MTFVRNEHGSIKQVCEFSRRLFVYSPFNVESSPVIAKAQQGLHVSFTQLKVKHLKEEERLKPKYKILSDDLVLTHYISKTKAIIFLSLKVVVPGSFPWFDEVLPTWQRQLHSSGCGTWWEPGENIIKKYRALFKHYSDSILSTYTTTQHYCTPMDLSLRATSFFHHVTTFPCWIFSCNFCVYNLTMLTWCKPRIPVWLSWTWTLCTWRPAQSPSCDSWADRKCVYSVKEMWCRHKHNQKCVSLYTNPVDKISWHFPKLLLYYDVLTHYFFLTCAEVLLYLVAMALILGSSSKEGSSVEALFVKQPAMSDGKSF